MESLLSELTTVFCSGSIQYRLKNSGSPYPIPIQFTMKEQFLQQTVKNGSTVLDVIDLHKLHWKYWRDGVDQ